VKPEEVGALLGGSHVEGLRRMSGGASRETWSFTADARALVLRRDPPGAGRAGMMRVEASLLTAAAAAGVPVPEVVANGDDWLVMAHVEGETIARKILRDDEYATARPLLAAQCGTVLAALHTIPTDVAALDEPDQLATWRETLDTLGRPHPAFELAFKWLGANRPPTTRRAVVHGDFRNGNFIVGSDGLRAVLDWELVHVGDPMEDLGWLCVKAWRFGNAALPVGGFGTYDDLVDAYERASGSAVDRDALLWWETLGTLKWGIMCILQATAHTSGAIRSVELAAIGRRVCENEWDLLLMLPSLASDQS
jgi:aminoglycoside phosphotransferase (APT) family kinase protein